MEREGEPEREGGTGAPVPFGIRAMATRSGTEFQTGANTSGAPEDIPDWAKSTVRSVEEFRRTQDETKAQIEFLMTQILDLKTVRPIKAPVHTTTPDNMQL